MTPTESPTVQLFAPHEWRTYRDLRLRALAESPDAFGSTVATERDRPDAEWIARLAAGADTGAHLPLLARLGFEPIGLAWGRRARAILRWRTCIRCGWHPNTGGWVRVGYSLMPRSLGRGTQVPATSNWRQRAGIRQPCVCISDWGFYRSGDPAPLRPGSPLMEQPMRLELHPVEEV